MSRAGTRHHAGAGSHAERAGPAQQLTVNFGFHRRGSVLGVTAGGVHNSRATYDEARIRERSRVIGYAIDARRRRFPAETPYTYQPIAGQEDDYRWTDAARASLRDYNLLDLSI